MYIHCMEGIEPYGSGIQKGGVCSQELLPTGFAAPLDEALDFLGSGAGRDEERVWHVDDH